MSEKRFGAQEAPEQIQQNNGNETNFSANDKGDADSNTRAEAEKLLRTKQEFCKIKWENGKEAEIEMERLDSLLAEIRNAVHEMEANDRPKAHISLIPNTLSDKGWLMSADPKEMLLNDLIIGSFESFNSYYIDKLIEFALGMSPSEFSEKYNIGTEGDHLIIERKTSADRKTHP